MFDELRTLLSVLTEIHQNSVMIHKVSVQLMNSLIKDDNDIVDYIIDRLSSKSNTKYNKKTISNTVRDVSLRIIHDADIITKEISEFAKAVAACDSIDDIQSEFFRNVWNGDMYGSTGIDGLHELNADLQEQLNSINAESLATKVLEELQSVYP